MKKQIHLYEELQIQLSNQMVDNKIYIEDCDVVFDVDVKEIIKLVSQTMSSIDNTIHSRIEIRNCRFRKVKVYGLTFENEITVVSSSFQEIYINDTNFHKDFHVIDCIIKCTILKNCNFYDNVSFGFNSKSVIQTIDIEDVDFGKDLEFSNLLMSKKLDEDGHRESSFGIYGRDTIIKHDLKIQNSIFLDSVIDVRCIINNEFRLYSINNIDDIFTGYTGTLQLYDSRVSILNIMCCKLAVIDIANSIFDNVVESDFQCKRMTEKTAITFRKFAIENSDPILEEKYTAQLYDELLRQKTVVSLKSKIASIGKNKNKNKVFVNKRRIHNFFEPIFLFFLSVFSRESLLLWLNKYSNDFNRSWTRGVKFTLLATLIFYFIINYCGTDIQYFVIDFKFQNFDEVFVGYLSLLDIFNLSNVSQPMQLTAWGKMLLFIAKIVIGYGSWQTIYAFYKYKR